MYKSILFFIFLFPIALFGQNLKSTEVRFGAAKVNITPEVPIPMSGYSNREKPFTEVHDDLFASALCFSNINTKVLIITADVISFNNILASEIKQKIEDKTGIPGENIFLTAAHNHGGPVIKAYEKDVSEEVEKYVDILQDKLVEIAAQAASQTVPVQIGYGSGSCSLNINRRAKFSDGSVWLGRNQDGPCDHEVSVLKIENENGKLLSLFVNWPCHGTASGQDNLEITGDWPGLAARYLNKKLGEDVIIAVTAGASGDINPIYGPNSNFREIEAVGTQLGAEVFRTLSEIETSPVYSIDITNKTLTLPGKKSGKGRYSKDIIEKGPDVDVNLSVCKIGNYVLSGISGEVMTEIGMNIKAASDYSRTMVITHCNGTSGYICTDAAYPEGGYEVNVTRLWPGSEKEITQNVVEMINTLN